MRLLITLGLILTSCAALRVKQSQSAVRNSVRESALFNKHFVGFVLYDPETGQYLHEQNADKYFNPASNTKLFTFYAGLKMLGDSLPGLKYVVRGDSLIFWGTGDPTFLHPDFPEQPIVDFLKNTDKQLYYAAGNFQDTHFGPGWAWDDYPYYFQSDRSGLPIYGNMVSFEMDGDSVKIEPPFFDEFTDLLSERKPSFYPNRNHDHNIFEFYADSSKSRRSNRVSFKTSDELLVKLLSDTLNRQVTAIPFKPRSESETLYSQPASLLYSWMLKASDNFMAEQLLYLCTSRAGDTLNAASVIAEMKASKLKDLPSEPIWRDGSGLSRYNLFTPRSMVALLEKIKAALPEKTLLALLPAGGRDGTLRKWYASDQGEPYVFAKTGTLSNNHTLSGFIRTKGRKLLTFSFMHNNYNASAASVKREMERVLRLIREKY